MTEEWQIFQDLSKYKSKRKMHNNDDLNKFVYAARKIRLQMDKEPRTNGMGIGWLYIFAVGKLFFPFRFLLLPPHRLHLLPSAFFCQWLFNVIWFLVLHFWAKYICSSNKFDYSQQMANVTMTGSDEAERDRKDKGVDEHTEKEHCDGL